MKRTPLSICLLAAVLIAASFFTKSSVAQEGQQKVLGLHSLLHSSVTLTYNSRTQAILMVKGTLDGIESNGVLVQTPKSKIWVPMVSILSIEAP